MKHIGHFNIGCNQAGKGDGLRPRAKRLNEDILLTPEDRKKREEELGKGMHCLVCGARVYTLSVHSHGQKSIAVGHCCANRIYL